MELLQLRYFLTTAEYQHMTKAAEHLQIAQPALSQAIHRLESELGIPLFERKNRSIELNDAGRLLQKRLIPIISALDRIPGELKAGQYLSSHTIHLKLLAASTLITNRIIAYRTLRPDVNFQLYQSDTNADFDLCVSAIRSDIKSEEYSDYMVMLEEDLYLAVPTHSPYGDKDSIRLTDTKNAGYICLSAEWGPLSPRSPVKLLPIKDQVCRRQIILMCSPHGRENPIVMDFCNFLIQNSKWL